MKKTKPKWMELDQLSPRELAQYVEWKDVKRALIFYYPGFTWKSYEQVLEIIKKRRKFRVKTTHRLEVYAHNTYYVDDKELEQGYGIHYIETNKIEYGRPKQWGMSFQSWDKLINMKFSKESFRNYSAADLMAHFIYELTWYGPESKTKKRGAAMLKTMKAFQKQVKDGTLKTVPIKDYLNKIKK